MSVSTSYALPPLSLNVGGTHFQTTVTTLQSVKNNYFTKSEAFLAYVHLNEDNFGEARPYFIDRDPEMFPFILSFLRGSSLVITTGPLSEKYAQIKLLEEAQFYEIQPLVYTLEKVLHQHPTFYPPTSLRSLWEILEELREEWQGLVDNESGQPSSHHPPNSQPTINEASSSAELQAEIQVYREAIKEQRLVHQVNLTQRFLAIFGVLIEQWAGKSPYARNFSQDFEAFLNSEKEETLRRVVQHHQEHREENHPYVSLLISVATFMLSRAFLSFDFPAVQNKSEEIQTNSEPSSSDTETGALTRLAESMARNLADDHPGLLEILQEGFQMVEPSEASGK